MSPPHAHSPVASVATSINVVGYCLQQQQGGRSAVQAVGCRLRPSLRRPAVSLLQAPKLSYLLVCQHLTYTSDYSCHR